MKKCNSSIAKIAAAVMSVAVVLMAMPAWAAPASSDEEQIPDGPTAVEALTSIVLGEVYTDKFDGDSDVTAICFTDSIPVTITALTPDAPPFGDLADIAVSSESASAIYDLPIFTQCGEYWYTVSGAAGSTAGVTYDTESSLYLHIVVTNEGGQPTVTQAQFHLSAPEADGSYTNETGDKTDHLTNQYAAGSLSITKAVEGNFVQGTEDDTYTVTVVFTAPEGKIVNSLIRYNDGAEKFIETGWTGTQTIELTMVKDGTVTFENIPEGVTYTVEESEAVGYELPYYTYKEADDDDRVSTGDNWDDCQAVGSISDATDVLIITNTMNAPIDVGVLLENAPYLLLFAGAGLVGILIIFSKKRTYED